MQNLTMLDLKSSLNSWLKTILVPIVNIDTNCCVLFSRLISSDTWMWVKPMNSLRVLTLAENLIVWLEYAQTVSVLKEYSRSDTTNLVLIGSDR